MSAPPIPNPENVAGWYAWSFYAADSKANGLMTLIRANHLAPEVARVLADHIRAARKVLADRHETPTPCPRSIKPPALVNRLRAMVELHREPAVMLGTDGGAELHGLVVWLDRVAREVYPPRELREWYAGLAPGGIPAPAELREEATT